MTIISTLRRSWIHQIFNRPRPRRRALHRAGPRPRYRPWLERLEHRWAPALTVPLTGTTVTLDETAGLQNDDTNVALPAAFSSRLTALGADPATALNAAVSNGNVVSISGVTGTIDNIAFTDSAGGALDGDPSGLFT